MFYPATSPQFNSDNKSILHLAFYYHQPNQKLKCINELRTMNHTELQTAFVHFTSMKESDNLPTSPSSTLSGIEK